MPRLPPPQSQSSSIITPLPSKTATPPGPGNKTPSSPSKLPLTGQPRIKPSAPLPSSTTRRSRHSLRAAPTSSKHVASAPAFTPAMPVLDRSEPANPPTAAASSTLRDPNAARLRAHGRQFTVGNIGNNGRIYLRPVIRPAAAAHRAPHDPTSPTPPFHFSPPPNDTTTLAPPTTPRRPRPVSSLARESTFSSTTRTARAPEPAPRDVPSSPSPPRATTHIRAHSFSTVDEHTAPQRPTIEAPGIFKVVIHRAPAARRGKPSGANLKSPVLEVPIPHYRLGTPQFGLGGTAILRSSVYTRSSGRDGGTSTPAREDRRARETRDSEMGRLAEEFPLSSLEGDMPRSRSSFTCPTTQPSATQLAPRIYDALVEAPDDASVVRYSSSTGEITAATPSRLIAHITSPSFLDYELLSDFFLTFRSFLAAEDLAAFLVARLRWAVDRSDDFGRIVRVRTFVALRHWILNYFRDDFVPDFELRIAFCALVNALYRDLRARDAGVTVASGPGTGAGAAGDIKIIGELKKCWRRTCAFHLDSVDDATSPEDDILPGRSALSSAEDLFSLNPAPTQQPPPQATQGHSTKPSTTSAPYSQPSAPHTQSHPHSSFHSQVHHPPLSPASDFSMHILSCSLPSRHPRPDGEIPLFPHPVPLPAGSSTHSPAPSRIHHAHKRSGSFSDALRARPRAPVAADYDAPSASAPSSYDSVYYNYLPPSSLVHGLVYAPVSPLFDMKPVPPAVKFRPDAPPEPPPQPPKAPPASPGVKRLLGTVRRALSTRQIAPQWVPDPMPRAYPRGAAASASELGLGPDTHNQLPPSLGKKRATRPQMRIDLLSARVGESFAAIVRSAEEEEERERRGEARDAGPGARSGYPVFGRSFTVGSRSIVIVDDTGSAAGEHPLPGEGKVSFAPVLPSVSGDEASLREAFIASSRAPPVPRVPSVHRDAGVSIDSVLGLVKGYKPRAAVPGVASPGNNKPPVYIPTGFHPPLDPRTSVRRAVSGHIQPLSGWSERDREASLTRGAFANSMRADSERSSTLRRYASYHGGGSVGMSPAPLVRWVHADADAEAGAEADADAEADESGLDEAFVLAPAPPRQLRRRPGGDLKAAVQVLDLRPAVRRPRSAGSLSGSSFAASGVGSFSMSPGHRRLRSGSAHVMSSPPGAGRRKSISLILTHSSQPNLRPSFEIEVAKLAALPDDVADGGREAALRKLEGRDGGEGGVEMGWRAEEEERPRTRGHLVPGESDLNRTLPSSGLGSAVHRMTSHSASASDVSYSSIPLLERGLSTSGPTKPPPPATGESDDEGGVAVPAVHLPSPTGSSMSHIHSTDSLRRIPKGATQPLRASPIIHASFLLDDNQDLSDSSSVLFTTEGGSESEPRSQGVRSFFDDEPLDAETVFTHPLRHPDTPPPTAPTLFAQGLPTPGVTPVAHGFDAHIHPAMRRASPGEPAPAQHGPAHLPFILAHDVETLVQQMTLIEKSALDEIDWNELIELRWNQAAPRVRDWAAYLASHPSARGVDLVIARFNLVAKWAVSEVVLTEEVEERARTVAQFIRVAGEARKVRNYATMYQITVALLSADCARLKATWSRVPEAEMRLLRELEDVVRPVRNFWNLRGEMEGGVGIEGGEGCIPFIGIYTRDLVYNASKPPYISTPPLNPLEPLVNFERHHTAATVVKSLLRLLEASSRYTYAVEPNVIAKCLWLAALGDEEIAARSRMCEP
ncbi:hypothetical protein EJ06DRAFT_491031 [Trichodelitschia bisporula]|uniref:Ras GEF n=1 Tax=Trichodelitschia bisporula TaxID=703511 RepID=A0A6G1I395_9PEZI|nr:hypothetical protein EJ06DRAFT_491031 [Trichodelitschia bisporula]